MKSPRDSGTRARRPGFTLVEMLFAVLILFLLMGLLIVGLNTAFGFARRTADTQTLTSLQSSVSLFKQEFGFIPPLVKDGFPPSSDLPLSKVNPATNRRTVNVYSVSDPNDLLSLQGRPTTRGSRQYSYYSMPYYLMGALDADVDGIDGPGMYEPARDGSFRTGGSRFDPMADVDQNDGGLNWVDRENGRVELRDRNGTPIRYYRWEPEDDVQVAADLNVPDLLGGGDSAKLRAANFAILLAGPDGKFGDEPIDPKNPNSAAERARARNDNVVGVGQ